jgi:beta-lactamase superfamily II metal-dependent hydrolase
LIGYSNQGESIVFLLKADGHVAYAGVVDCYECNSINKTIDILNTEGVEKIDFLCWTHPHDDHTVGLNRILESFCDDRTKIWITDIYPKSYDNYSQESIKLYESIKNRITKRNSNVKIATDNKLYKANPENYVGNTADACTLIRLAITGRTNSPDLYSICAVLGDNLVQEKIQKFIDILI